MLRYCRVLVSAPKANGSVSAEGGVYSCPFDVREMCQFQPLFQSREGEENSDPLERGNPSSVRTVGPQYIELPL